MSHTHLAESDPEIAALIRAEERRQHRALRLIPSENYAPAEVMEACGSVLNNKYSEGYAGRRYYEGQQNIDAIEELAIARLKSLFGADHANVQPYSGSPANLAVYFAFCDAGDPVMGMGLPSGGHLTHGWKVSITGKYFQPVQYGVRREDHLIDFDEVARLAREHKPKVLFCGATAYPRVIDFAKFAEIAREVGAILVADIAHISGLIAGGAHPSPVGLAEVVTSTTHKTFRGPRGGMILCDKAHKKAIDRAVFPGLQGGPHNGTTAGIAVAAKLAAGEDFKRYAHQIVANSRALAERLRHHGFDLVTGGSDNHLILIDLSSKGVPGKVASQALDKAGIVTNYNSVPFDTRKPFDPSGVRIGTPAVTSRGMGPSEMAKLGDWMAEVIGHLDDETVLARVAGEVKALCDHFPAPGVPVS
ncbi:MAG: serine hydroxymethyltransferase [Myxococcales bacterium]|nr:serine hydroxymethyltransferase [Myxococcales bacterium]MCA9602137.1 serine hydroxymethyltransferase [Myxococcales bacterium]